MELKIKRERLSLLPFGKFDSFNFRTKRRRVFAHNVYSSLVNSEKNRNLIGCICELSPT